MNVLHQLKEQSVADALTVALSKQGVSRVFGVPGGAIEPLMNALAGHDSRIRFVHARHESGAATMAHGYALASGIIGVCCATTGPGATNLITGVSAAFLDHAPMLVITGQNPHSKTGRPALQDSTAFGIDTVEIFRKCTKYSAVVPSAEVLPSIFAKAMQIACTPPLGPVHLSIPTDVLKEPLESPLVVPAIPLAEHPCAQIKVLLDAVTHKKLSLYIGRRALTVSTELEQFIQQHRIPFVCSPQGKAAIRSTLPFCAGVFGFCGHDNAQQLLRDSEVVLAIGANMEELSTNGWHADLCNDKLYCISDDPDDLQRSYGLAHVLGVDVKTALAAMRQCLSPMWEQPPINPYPMIDMLCKAQTIDHPATMLSHILAMLYRPGLHTYLEAGNSWCWYLHYVASARAFMEANFGAMGWAIGAGIGACAHTGQQTVVISGDGAFLMHGNELSTAVEQQLPMVFVVLNDGGLGMVRHGQRLSKSASIGHSFPQTSYAGMAVALGAQSITIETEMQLLTLDWSVIRQCRTPLVIECLVDPEIQPPMGRRIESLMNC